MSSTASAAKGEHSRHGSLRADSGNGSSGPPNRMKVLISAYACESGMGSEPGIGWNLATHLSRHHRVWVITRANNREAIERELTRSAHSGLEFVYFDLPPWARWWKRKQRGVRTYYYLWQLGVYFVGRRLHRRIGFDVVHHLTFGKYWAPSCLALLPAPFVWGPVGGGESTPRGIRSSFSTPGRLYEAVRSVARWVSTRDPLLLLTARRSVLALANTPETGSRLRRVGARRVDVLSHAALTDEQISEVDFESPRSSPLRFVSIGRLIHWKGFHIGLQAFALADLDAAEYWVIGSGPEEARLRRLSASLGLEDRVSFFGELSRRETFDRLRSSHVLVHPSLHDSAPTVCIEAMAARRPVICVDTGGPATQITDDTGFKVPVADTDAVVEGVAVAMHALATDDALRCRMGEMGRKRVIENFTWQLKASAIAGWYARVANVNAPARRATEVTG